MRNRYLLPNRDQRRVWLERNNGNEYILKQTEDLPYSVTYSVDHTRILAVDPSGGPLINVGYSISRTVYVKEIIWTQVDGLKFILDVCKS